MLFAFAITYHHMSANSSLVSLYRWRTTMRATSLRDFQRSRLSRNPVFVNPVRRDHGCIRGNNKVSAIAVPVFCNDGGTSGTRSPITSAQGHWKFAARASGEKPNSCHRTAVCRVFRRCVRHETDSKACRDDRRGGLVHFLKCHNPMPAVLRGQLGQAAGVRPISASRCGSRPSVDQNRRIDQTAHHRSKQQ